MNSNQDEPQEIVRKLLLVLSRQASFDDAKALLNDNLTVYMDGKALSKDSKAWFRWVKFLHRNADKKMSGLTTDVERIESEGEIVRVFAKWRAEIKGETLFSDVREVIYQVQEGKITTIWTHKKNYTFIYGKTVATLPGFYWVVFRMLLTG